MEVARFGGFRMSMKPSLNTLYLPFSICSTATLRVNTAEAGEFRHLGHRLLAEVVGRGLGPVDRVVHDRVDDRLRIE